MIEVWISNYLHLRPRAKKGVNLYQPEYYKAQIFWLAVIARGICHLAESERIIGNPRMERTFRWALATFRRVADFTLLQPHSGSVYLDQIREAQKRMEGMLGV